MHCLDSVSLRPSFFTNLSHQNQARKYSAFRRELLLPLSLFSFYVRGFSGLSLLLIF